MLKVIDRETVIVGVTLITSSDKVKLTSVEVVNELSFDEIAVALIP